MFVQGLCWRWNLWPSGCNDRYPQWSSDLFTCHRWEGRFQLWGLLLLVWGGQWWCLGPLSHSSSCCSRWVALIWQSDMCLEIRPCRPWVQKSWLSFWFYSYLLESLVTAWSSLSYGMEHGHLLPSAFYSNSWSPSATWTDFSWCTSTLWSLSCLLRPTCALFQTQTGPPGAVCSHVLYLSLVFDSQAGSQRYSEIELMRRFWASLRPPYLYLQ